MQLCIRMPITGVFGAFSQDSSGSMAGLDFTLGQGHASPILSMQGYRQAQEEDLETLYDICLQTAWAGGDASGEVFYSDLLGDLFVGPYHASQHSMAEVLCDDDGIVGYLLMTSDTRSFQKWFRMDWLPKIRKKWPISGLMKPFTDTDVALWESLTEDQTYHPPWMRQYPAHLHLSLLPQYQGRGMGSRWVSRAEQILSHQACLGVHVSVHPDNCRAQNFFSKAGYAFIEHADLPWEEVYFMGKSLIHPRQP